MVPVHIDGVNNNNNNPGHSYLPRKGSGLRFQTDLFVEVGLFKCALADRRMSVIQVFLGDNARDFFFFFWLFCLFLAGMPNTNTHREHTHMQTEERSL